MTCGPVLKNEYILKLTVIFFQLLFLECIDIILMLANNLKKMSGCIPPP